MVFDTSKEVFCPMIKATIKSGQCLDIQFELMGSGEMENLTAIVRAHQMEFDDIQACCNKCEFQPFKKVGAEKME